MLCVLLSRSLQVLAFLTPNPDPGELPAATLASVQWIPVQPFSVTRIPTPCHLRMSESTASEPALAQD